MLLNECMRVPLVMSPCKYKHTWSKVCRWPPKTIIRLFLTLNRVQVGEVLFDCGVLRKLLSSDAHVSWNSRRTPPRTCRADRIAAPGTEALLTFQGPRPAQTWRSGTLYPTGQSPSSLPSQPLKKDPPPTPLPKNDHTEFQVIWNRMFRFCRLSFGPHSYVSYCSAITNARRGYILGK